MEESVSIIGRYNDISEYVGKVPRVFYERVIKRLVRVEQSQVTGYKLKCVLFEKGWISVPGDKEPLSYLQDLDVYSGDVTLKAVYDAIFNSTVSVQFLDKLLTMHIEDEGKLSQVYKELIDQQGLVHLESFVGERISELFGREHERDAVKLLKSLWGVTPAKGGVSVGKGEIALCLLTGAKKASEGDLAVPDDTRLVEVKGPDGKIGSKPFSGTIQHRIAKRLGITSQELAGRYHLYMQSKARLEQIDSIVEDIRLRREHLKRRLLRRQVELESKSKPNKRENQALVNIRDIKRYLRDIGQEALPKETTGTTVNKLSLKHLHTNYISLQKLKTCQAYLASSEQVISFGKVARVIFEHILHSPNDALHGIVSNSIIEMLCEFRNYDLHYDTKRLEDAIQNTITQNNIHIYEWPSVTKLIMIMHIALYWRECQFTDIQFISNSPLTCLTLQMSMEGSDLSTVLDYLWCRVPDILTTNLRVAPMSPTGVEVRIQ